MKKLLSTLFALSLLTPLVLVAQQQDTTTSGTSTAASQDSSNSMKADTGMAKHIMGKISDDGKTFVSDKDGKSWTISNPDAVKGHEGHHVALKANVSSDKTSINVVSLKMAGSDGMKKDTTSN